MCDKWGDDEQASRKNAWQTGIFPRVSIGWFVQPGIKFLPCCLTEVHEAGPLGRLCWGMVAARGVMRGWVAWLGMEVMGLRGFFRGLGCREGSLGVRMEGGRCEKCLGCTGKTGVVDLFLYLECELH